MGETKIDMELETRDDKGRVNEISLRCLVEQGRGNGSKLVNKGRNSINGGGHFQDYRNITKRTTEPQPNMLWTNGRITNIRSKANGRGEG